MVRQVERRETLIPIWLSRVYKSFVQVVQIDWLGYPYGLFMHTEHSFGTNFAKILANIKISQYCIHIGYFQVHITNIIDMAILVMIV